MEEVRMRRIGHDLGREEKRGIHPSAVYDHERIVDVFFPFMQQIF